MPGFDRTGPRGMGPLTGRRLGRCVAMEPDVQDAVQTERQMLIGRGRGGVARGGVRGFGRRWTQRRF
ncbi:hypothetical protein FTO68_06610 [Methanocalculus taiwanensis]|uniref:Uncharacterized protein n=1 Tax=Methanocalculus taiwanensis TaxID=106207 RepID=A0ABD4TMY9_9EURY|nr:DUF5320 domain-containing protein [Methanocalculus taiwanensis]MCQ1538655.1 hypothetical protein [Methanocalculus taiwanensis]